METLHPDHFQWHVLRKHPSILQFDGSTSQGSHLQKYLLSFQFTPSLPFIVKGVERKVEEFDFYEVNIMKPFECLVK